MDCPYHNMCTNKNMCLMMKPSCTDCVSPYRKSCQRMGRFFKYCPIGCQYCDTSIAISFNKKVLESIGFIP